MKRILFAVLAVVMLLSGCANGIKAARETDLQAFKRNDFGKVIYYKPVYYQAGMTQWTYVGSAPEANPSKELVRFKEILIAETAELMGKNGFKMVEAGKNPGNGIFIEMHIAAIKPVPFIQDPVGATRWYVFSPSSKNPVEIYKFSLHNSLGFGSLDENLAKDVAQEATSYFLSIVPGR